MEERDTRADMINTLLTTPHRDLTALFPVHQGMLEQDPLFYVHLAAWYADKGAVRDHKELFVVMLCLSSFPGHRDVGLALLRELPPYEVARVVDFVKGTTITRHEKAQKPGRGKVQTKNVVRRVEVGCNANVPRSMRTEIMRYLREREENDGRFDRTALQAREALKRLYAGLHIPPSPRAQAILFDEQPPQDSLAYQVRLISKAQTPAEQARTIVDNHIPYRVASSVIKEMSPMVLAALIEVMTPAETINNLASLKKHGAFDNADLKGLIEARLEAAKTDRRVSAYKAKVAIEAAELNGEIAETLDTITETQIKARGRITRPTALLVDKSGSMDTAIEVGRQLGALVSSITEADLYTYAFDTVAYPIQANGTSLAAWENAFRGINAVGGTSCGVALERMTQLKQRVEQIVMVTDEGENSAPRFQEAYDVYSREVGIHPAVILVTIGKTGSQIQHACAALGVAPSVFEFQGDYYSLPNLIPLLAYPSAREMVMDVLAYPLPQRKLS